MLNTSSLDGITHTAFTNFSRILHATTPSRLPPASARIVPTSQFRNIVNSVTPSKALRSKEYIGNVLSLLRRTITAPTPKPMLATSSFVDVPLTTTTSVGTSIGTSSTMSNVAGGLSKLGPLGLVIAAVAVVGAIVGTYFLLKSGGKQSLSDVSVDQVTGNAPADPETIGGVSKALYGEYLHQPMRVFRDDTASSSLKILIKTFFHGLPFLSFSP